MTGRVSLTRRRLDRWSPALDEARVVDRWSAAVPTLDHDTARAVVRALLHQSTAVDVASALLAFDPDLAVTVDSLRALRVILLEETERIRLADDAAVVVLRRFDDLFGLVAERSVEQLEGLALVDPLTGLGNRRAADGDLERAIAHARRHGRVVTIASIDLDGLKRVNDERGHAAGDAVLRAFADALRATARLDDGSYRCGGDEFLVIAPDSEPAAIDRFLERLRLTAPAFSAGIACAPVDAEDAGDLLAAADARLYERKQLHHRDVAVRRRPLARLAPFVGAAVVVELLRAVFDVPLHGGRLAIWGMLVGAVPTATALLTVDRTVPWRPPQPIGAIVARAALLALVLLAVLVPLAGAGAG
jgi:diguanylate cyclase (GGDEF)-like protein